LDVPRSILFYFFAAVALAGALGAALAPSRRLRAGALALLGVGLAALFADLSAVFAAAATLVAYLSMAALFLGRRFLNDAREAAAGRWHQVGGVAAALIFAGLAYAALRGPFHGAGYPGGQIGAAAVGRQLLARDALALEAVAALVTVALVLLAWTFRARRR
jgi:NADH:ubiquinone oxidoreductase subunit 6 (subunit J)